MNNLVSVVVTCYNHEQYIEECLRSIFKQTYTNIELLIFNDGSKDSSGEIIKSVLKDSPFKDTNYFEHSNMGLVATRNRAFEYINGEYLLFVDSDNFLQENYIEQLLLTSIENNFDIVYSKLVNPDNNNIVLELQPFNLDHFYIENFIDSCSLIKRNIIGNIRYDDYLNYKKLEDYDFFMNLIILNNAIPGPCENTYLNYRVIDTSMSARDDLKYYYQVYSYILGKYFSYNPKLAQNALKINFERLYNLSNIDGQYENQKLTIYYTSENKPFFSQDSILEYDLKKSDKIKIKVPNDTTYIRIDLGELPSFYNDISLVNLSTNTSLIGIHSNGININNGMIFNEFDPQIIYDIKSIQLKNLELLYSRFNIANIYSDDYIGKILGEKITNYKEVVAERDLFLQNFSQTLTERDYYKNELEEMVVRYNSVTHSRRWTIPTKIINFFNKILQSKS